MLAPCSTSPTSFSELRRRKGRTLLTALGLGVGVGLVVTVSALSAGLDKAQKKVLEPLTGVGTDMSVTRPLKLSGNGPAGLSESERDQLEEENGPRRFDLGKQAEPGEKFTRTDFMSAAQLSFPASQVAKIAALDGVKDAAGSLTLTAVTIKGTVPEGGFRAPQVQRSGPPADGSQPQTQRAPFDVNSMSVTGVDRAKPELAPPTRSPGRSYARRRPRGGRERVLRQAPRHLGRRDDHARRQEVHGRRARRARRSAARPPTSTSSSPSCRR